jgi:hypothetical protein
MHQNAPFPSHLNAYADFAGRFWYWRGQSGRHYIHSVYTPKTCPPLPSGVFIAVERLGDVRRAIAVGLFRDMFDPDTMQLSALAAREADELHVHLLARRSAEAEAVARDLAAMMRADLVPAQIVRTAEPARLSPAKARAA